MVVGGGIGGIIILILTLLFNGVFGGRRRPHRWGERLRPQPGGGSRRTRTPPAFQQCKTGADANKYTDLPRHRHGELGADLLGRASCRGTARSGSRPRRCSTTARTQSACGTASNQVGPVLLPPRQAGLHRRQLLQDPRGPVRLQRWAARAGVRRRPRVRPRAPGPARPARPRPAGPAGGQLRRRAHRADGRLPRRRVGQARHDRQGRGHRHAVPQAADDTGHQGRPLRGLRRWATTASSRRPRAGSTPRAGRTARPRPVSAGSSRASRPATSTSATPSAAATVE